ncbi:MAG: thiamine biosynthesis protein ThiS [Bacteroidetes bacterium SW_11_45_7]|nr:MAG: thiamine biosynthesis protein ThiS [Bacteroidetes bacterium SW_11_45_7]
MELIVNDKSQQVTDNITADQLLQELGWDSKQGVAVAVNDEVVPRENWQDQQLSDQDRVIIIQATQGG